MKSDGQSVNVVGAGIAGSWTALLLTKAGCRVTLYDRAPADDPSATTSWWAGGMLAPDCESEGAEPIVVDLGRRSLDLWRRVVPDTILNGSLVVAHPRDRGELERFARQTTGYERIGPERIAVLEPALAGRFAEALFFPNEGHVEPRRALRFIRERLEERGVGLHFGAAFDPATLDGRVIDCRGLAARDTQPELRGVRGETVLVETDEITLSRPVRLMHPRWPLYVIPRAAGRFLVGATSIESEDEGGVTVRAALELLSAAYAVHPAFGEARIVELGHGLRPAFPDNAPRISVSARPDRGEVIAVNGLYRHGYMMAPALAETVTRFVVEGTRDNELMRWC